MMKSFSVLLIVPLFFISTTKPKVEMMDFATLDKEIESWEDGIYIVNFWATWCMPCVKELPYFESINRDFANENVKVVLVNLNFASELESKVKPFVEKHDLHSRVILLNAPDYNSWIDKVSTKWSGSIPATLVINAKNKKSEFYEQSLNYKELEEIIKNLKTK
ncbi:MAG: TlpA family protein disulfide reductase [Chitinophagales bacterium]|nr:TlpA family protein disulfide reductase [Chitinophagales bacterium]